MGIDAEHRARMYRMMAKGRAVVSHPEHGEITVPAASKLAAIMCAAEKWGVPWDKLLDAAVMRGDEEDNVRRKMDHKGM